MTDSLFDADLYGPGRKTRAPAKPKPLNLVENEGSWFVVTRKNKEPHPQAHRLEMKMMTVYRDGRAYLTGWDGKRPWEGAWKTPCGLIGAVVPVPPGYVNVCPECEKKPGLIP